MKFISLPIQFDEKRYELNPLFGMLLELKKNNQNLKLWINGTEVALPSVTLATTNVMQSVGYIAIPAAAVYEIKLQNFDDVNDGIRIDNVKFSATTAIKNVIIDNSVYATNGTVYAEGEFQIFSVAGQNVTELNGQLNGIYVVKTAKGIQKVAVK